MQIFIDGEKQEFVLDNIETLNAFIEMLKPIVDKQDKVMKSIKVDDIMFGEENAKIFEEKQLSQINKIEITTDSPLALAVITLKRAQEYLDGFKGQVEKFLDVLQTGGEEDAYDVFVKDLDGWKTVIQLVDLVGSLLCVDFNTVIVGEQTVDAISDDLQNILAQVKISIETQDIVYLQDLLRYELLPAVDKVAQIVVELTTIIDKKTEAVAAI